MRAFTRNIVSMFKTHAVRFLAIFAIIALGAGVFASLRVFVPDMRATADHFYDELNFYDIRITSSVGLSDQDIEDLRAIEGVTHVSTAFSAEATLARDGANLSARMEAIDFNETDRVNQLRVIEGRLPANDHEMVVGNAADNPLHIGDVVSVAKLYGIDSPHDSLSNTTFTVVGRVVSPAYIKDMTTISLLTNARLVTFAYIDSSALKADTCPTDAYLTVAGAHECVAFSDEYKRCVEPVKDHIRSMAQAHAEAHRAQLIADAQRKIDDAKATLIDQRKLATEQIASGQASIDAALARLSQAQESVKDGSSQIAQQRQALKQAYDTLANTKAELVKGQTKLAKALIEIEAKQTALNQSYNQGKQEIAAKRTELLQRLPAGFDPTKVKDPESLPPDLKAAYLEYLTAMHMIETQELNLEAVKNQGQAQIDEARSQIDQQQTKLNQGWDAYYAGIEQVKSGEQKLLSGEAQLKTSQADLTSGKNALASRQQELDRARQQAEQELAQGDQEVVEAQGLIDKIPSARWYILDRGANETYADFNLNAERMRQITTIFPIFFFLVAALVALTSMTRIIDADRIEVGTLKALGYRRTQIGQKYLIFAGSASLTGAVVGIVALSYILPRVIWMSYRTQYQQVEFVSSLDLTSAATAAIISVLVTIGVSAAAIRLTLSETPAALMIPRAPKPGKRILLERIAWLWRHLSFSYKVTARNLFRYKKRLFMTVMGVAGCTALLLTGFGIQDHLSTFVVNHFYGLRNVDAEIIFDPDADPQAGKGDMQSSVATSCNEIDAQWIFVSRESALASNPQASVDRIPFGAGGKESSDSAQSLMRNARSDLEPTGPGEGVTRDVSISVPQDIDRFTQFIQLRNAKGWIDGLTPAPQNEMLNVHDLDVNPSSDATAGTADEGSAPAPVFISLRLSENLQVSVGDTILIAESADEPTHQVRVAGIFESYLFHELVMSPQGYAQTFGKAPTYSFVYLTMNRHDEAGTEFTPHLGDDPSQEVRDLLASRLTDENPAITSIAYPRDLAENVAALANNLHGVVVLICCISGALAFIVLFNLTNINVEERVREIATLKVLGFYHREVDGYIFRETFLLSLFGALFGLPLGYALCTYIMRCAEYDYIMFQRHIAWQSYLYAFCLTLVFTLVVMGAIHRRLTRIDMVSSLKANE